MLSPNIRLETRLADTPPAISAAGHPEPQTDQHEKQRFPHDEPYDAAPLGPERHADAHLTSPPGDAERHQAVESDRRQDQG